MIKTMDESRCFSSSESKRIILHYIQYSESKKKSFFVNDWPQFFFASKQKPQHNTIKLILLNKNCGDLIGFKFKFLT